MPVHVENQCPGTEVCLVLLTFQLAVEPVSCAHRSTIVYSLTWRLSHENLCGAFVISF